MLPSLEFIPRMPQALFPVYSAALEALPAVRSLSILCKSRDSLDEIPWHERVSQPALESGNDDPLDALAHVAEKVAVAAIKGSEQKKDAKRWVFLDFPAFSPLVWSLPHMRIIACVRLQ